VVVVVVVAAAATEPPPRQAAAAAELEQVWLEVAEAQVVLEALRERRAAAAG